MNEHKLEKIIDNFLEDKSFEDFLEEFNLTPQEVVINLYESGLLDDDQLERLIPADA